MSLISEALKRQQMEREGKEPPPDADPPAEAAPEDAPESPPAEGGSALSLAAAAKAGRNTPEAAPAEPEASEAAPEPTSDAGASGLSLAAAAAASPTPAAEVPPVATPEAAPPPPPPPPPIEPVVETAQEPAIAETVVQEPKSEGNGAPAWAVFTGAVVVIGLLIGGAVWGGMYAFRQVATDPDEPEVASDPGPAEVATAVPAPAPAAALPAVPDLAPDSSVPPAVADSETAVTPPGQPAPAAPAVAPPAAVAEAPRPEQPTAAGPASSRDWPTLSLSGLVGGRKGGAAIINSQVIGIGEMIDGAMVIDLTKKGATMEYQGERRFLRVGGVID